MADPIFLIGKGDELTQLETTPYQNEDLLQELVAKFPEVLASVAGSFGKLMLIRREQSVSDRENGGGRWSLDHLFVDSNAVPVLVETKRASDTRARREVVAQMLDYAANGVAYWPIGDLIAGFEKVCEETGTSAADRLGDFLAPDEEPETFWRQVEANLRSGRIRMVFVADEIAPELQRIVEFLNEQMRPAEVLAIKLAQYTSSDDLRTLVPSLIGATQRAKAVKQTTREELPPITYEDWLAELEEKAGLDARKAVEKLSNWATGCGWKVAPTRTQDSLYIAMKNIAGKWVYPFFQRRSSLRVEIDFMHLKVRGRLQDEGVRRSYVEEIASIPGIAMGSMNPSGFPSFDLLDLLKPVVFERVIEIFTRLVHDLDN